MIVKRLTQTDAVLPNVLVSIALVLIAVTLLAVIIEIGTNPTAIANASFGLID